MLDISAHVPARTSCLGTTLAPSQPKPAGVAAEEPRKGIRDKDHLGARNAKILQTAKKNEEGEVRTGRTVNNVVRTWLKCRRFPRNLGAPAIYLLYT